MPRPQTAGKPPCNTVAVARRPSPRGVSTIDQEGFVLGVLVQNRHDAKVAKGLLRKLLKTQGRALRAMITDMLRSYGAAKKDSKLVSEHRQHKGLNNRAKNSHQPIRGRQRQMKCFKSARQVQRFLSIHDPIANLFHPLRNLSASAFATWAAVARARLAA